MPIFVDRNIFSNLPVMVNAAILNFTYNFLYDSKKSYNVYGVIPGKNTFILTYYMPIFVDRNIFFKFAGYGQGGHFEFHIQFLI